MDRNSNAYTFIFAIVTVVLVAASLAYAATSLKPLQDENIKNEKMQNIVSTIGIDVPRSEAGESFRQYIKQELALKGDGSVDENVNAFNIDLKKETKKPSEEQRFPIYVAEKDGNTFYIVPLYGAGLWDAIWGYLALDADKNTVIGASFDHKSETPGLGAEINQSWFEDEFKGKTLFNEKGDFVSVKTVKGGAEVGDMHGVDGISGGTITSDGVSNMIQERMQNYIPYLKNN